MSVLLVATALAAAAAAPEPRLAVALTPQELTVGDRVTAVLTVTVPAQKLAGEPRFPTWGETWGEAEIHAVDEPRASTRQGVATYRQRLVLTAFRPGEIPLPPRSVAVPLGERTVRLDTPADLALTVTSVLPQPPEPGAAGGEPETVELSRRPPAPPQPLPLGGRFWVAATALAAAALLLAALLWRRRVGAAEAPKTAPLAPIEELERELAALTAEPSLVFAHARLSLALRRYLGRVLAFPAPESTTREIRRQLAGRHLPGEAVRHAGEVLSGCDLVKFARQEVARDRLSERAAAAREIARAIERHLRPPAEDEPLERAG